MGNAHNDWIIKYSAILQITVALNHSGLQESKDAEGYQEIKLILEVSSAESTQVLWHSISKGFSFWFLSPILILIERFR